jgi:hypothetical protein
MILGQPNAESDERQKSKMVSPKATDIDANIIRTLKSHVRSVLEACTFERPAKIESLQFEGDSIVLAIRWPFWLPPPTGHEGDYLSTRKSLKRFQQGFRRHLLEEQAGRKLSNLIYQELIEFTLRFMRIHRFGPKTVMQLRSIGGQRLAGRPASQPISKREVRWIKTEGQEIQDVIKQIRRSLKPGLALSEAAMLNKISLTYKRDAYPWMRSLRPALRDLHGGRSLTAPDTWSVKDLAAEIIRKERYRETGMSYSLQAIKRALRP